MCGAPFFPLLYVPQNHGICAISQSLRKITPCAEAELIIGMTREYFGSTKSPSRNNTKLKDLQDQAQTLHLGLSWKPCPGDETHGNGHWCRERRRREGQEPSTSSVSRLRECHECASVANTSLLWGTSQASPAVSRMPAWNMVLHCLNPGTKVILNQNCYFILESFSRSNQFSWSKKSFSLNLRAGFYNFPNFCETLCSHSSKKFSFYLFECEERIKILFHNSASSHFLSSLNSIL